MNLMLHRRPLIPGETDPELTWGSVLGCSAAAVGACLLAGLPMPHCPFHVLTGLPCPTCGTTRAASALLHGDPAGAIAWNPLTTFLLAGAAIYVLYAAVVVIGKLPRLRWTNPSERQARWIRIAVVGLLGANWVYLVWRGV